MANAMNMKAAVCNGLHLEPREGELDRSGSYLIKQSGQVGLQH